MAQQTIQMNVLPVLICIHLVQAQVFTAMSAVVPKIQIALYHIHNAVLDITYQNLVSIMTVCVHHALIVATRLIIKYYAQNIRIVFVKHCAQQVLIVQI
jgi:hypothetical protein